MISTSNQDHSALPGVETMDNLLVGTPEHTVRRIMGIEPPAVAS
ncbi:MAG TPA: hypothetical protein VGI92_08180 [Gemmatimonadales bacterium]|jgi:hypothetical protein